jgi:hypothetical protein
MTEEENKTAQFVFTVVVIPDNKRYEVELWDFAGTKPDLIAAGEGSNWRTALGEALSRIDLPMDKQEKTINDLVKENAEDEGI